MDDLKNVTADLLAARSAINKVLRTLEQHDLKADDGEALVWRHLRTISTETTPKQVAAAIGIDVVSSKSVSMRVATHMKNAGWVQHRKVSGTRYWKRGPAADPYKPVYVMPRPV